MCSQALRCPLVLPVSILWLFAYISIWGLAQTQGAEFRAGFSANMSRTLDNLLAGGRYDKRIRPGIGGPPIVVAVNMHIKSFGPISETGQSYTMDVYFRQSWYDLRLQYSLQGLDEISMSWLFLDKVWKPDTYFMNGKTSHLHRITSPNKFLRLRPDGYLVYSMRLTISARCKMHLRKFPMDTQRCTLLIGSYGYSSNEIMYKWEPGVTVEPGLELSQYDLANISIESHTIFQRNVGKFSMIKAHFLLRRNLGYYVLQMYVPCCLIVCCSFVSFWINPDDVPGRITLAATTVLSITTLGFIGRAALPKVNYATALDWFVILCFGTVFAVLVEYAVINFIDKIRVDIMRLLEERKKQQELRETKKEEEDEDEEEEKGDEEEDAILDNMDAGVPTMPLSVPKIMMTYEMDDLVDDQSSAGEIEDLDPLKVDHLSVPFAETKMKVTRSYSVPTMTRGEYRFDQPRLVQDTSIDILLDQHQEPLSARVTLRSTLLIPVKMLKRLHILPTEEEVAAATEPPNKFSRIDTYSRFLFPLTYILLLSCYYLVYTYYMVDDKERYVTRHN